MLLQPHNKQHAAEARLLLLSPSHWFAYLNLKKKGNFHFNIPNMWSFRLIYIVNLGASTGTLMSVRIGFPTHTTTRIYDHTSSFKRCPLLLSGFKSKLLLTACTDLLRVSALFLSIRKQMLLFGGFLDTKRFYRVLLKSQGVEYPEPFLSLRGWTGLSIQKVLSSIFTVLRKLYTRTTVFIVSSCIIVLFSAICWVHTQDSFQIYTPGFYVL